jgi:hypothetical protein
MIQEYLRYEYLHYYRNGESLGFDKNLLLTVERSKGTYLWFFGDDDELLPGAVAHVLRLINAYPDMSYAWVNGYRGWIGPHKPFSNRTTDMFYGDRNEVIENLAGLLGFMSAIILKREKLFGLETKNYIGSGFIHLHMVFHVLSQEGQFYYVGNPYVCQHYTPGTKMDTLQVLVIDFSEVVMTWKSHFDEKFIQTVLDKNFGQLWRQLYVENITNPKVLSGRRKMIIEMNKHSLKFCFIILPCLLIPSPFNRILYKLSKMVTRQATPVLGD